MRFSGVRDTCEMPNANVLDTSEMQNVKMRNASVGTGTPVNLDTFRVEKIADVLDTDTIRNAGVRDTGESGIAGVLDTGKRILYCYLFFTTLKPLLQI